MFKFHGVIAIASPEESHARDGEDGHCGGEGHTHPAYHQQWHLRLNDIFKTHTDGLLRVLELVEEVPCEEVSGLQVPCQEHQGHWRGHQGPGDGEDDVSTAEGHLEILVTWQLPLWSNGDHGG